MAAEGLKAFLDPIGYSFILMNLVKARMVKQRTYGCLHKDVLLQEPRQPGCPVAQQFG